MTYKKLKTIAHTIILANGETEEIKLPINYQIVFDNIRNNSASEEQKMLYVKFAAKYAKLDQLDKEKYQHIANSGRVRTESLLDLMHIFNVICEYLRIYNVDSFETIGRLYASMNGLEYSGDTSKVDMRLKYAELGEAVCEIQEGFIADGMCYIKPAAADTHE